MYQRVVLLGEVKRRFESCGGPSVHQAPRHFDMLLKLVSVLLYYRQRPKVLPLSSILVPQVPFISPNLLGSVEVV